MRCHVRDSCDEPRPRRVRATNVRQLLPIHHAPRPRHRCRRLPGISRRGSMRPARDGRHRSRRPFGQLTSTTYPTPWTGAKAIFATSISCGPCGSTLDSTTCTTWGHTQPQRLSHFIRRYNYNTNLIANVNPINEAILHHAKRFVSTSSIAAYGADQLPMTEDLVPQPADPYVVSKYAVELDCRRQPRRRAEQLLELRRGAAAGEPEHVAGVVRPREQRIGAAGVAHMPSDGSPTHARRRGTSAPPSSTQQHGGRGQQRAGERQPLLRVVAEPGRRPGRAAASARPTCSSTSRARARAARLPSPCSRAKNSRFSSPDSRS